MKINLYKIRMPFFVLFAIIGSAFIIHYYKTLTDASFFIFCSLLFVLLTYTYLKPNRSILPYAFLLGLSFALSIIIGYSYDNYNNYSLIFKNLSSLVSAALAIFALHIFLFCLIAILFSFILHYQVAPDVLFLSKYQLKSVSLVMFLIILTGSIPYLILYSPGLNIFDTHDQILQFFGYPSYIGDGSALSDHHPVLLTLLYGFFIKMGITLNNASTGQMIYSLISLIAISFCFSMAFTHLILYGMPLRIGIAFSIFIAIWPVTATYAFNMCKDVTIAPVIILFAIQMTDLHFSNGLCFKRLSFCIPFVLYSILILLMRKSAFVAMLLTCITFITVYKSVRTRIVTLFSIIIGVFLIYQTILLPIFHVIPGESREMLSIPFQQTARYLQQYPEDISSSESENIFRVLNPDAIQNYDPRLSDPIKDTSNPNATINDYFQYFKSWLSMGVRHPGVYLDAWLNMIYGYFYPSESNTILCLTLNSPDKDDLVLKQNAKLQPLRLQFYNFVYYTLRRIPVLGQLFYVSSISWCFLFILFILFYKYREKGLAPWAFFIASFGVCLFSPKSGEIRYLLPILYTLPLMAGLILTGKETETL